MEISEFEELLTGAQETDALEFKGAMHWNRDSLVKDILAMANVIDGGRIIIGIQDKTLAREGLTEDQVNSFNIEKMRDSVAPFADPGVVFNCKFTSDRSGLRFVVIEVEPFTELPVICKKDGKDVKAGTIYFRSKNRRPQSARISDSSEMRELVLRSAALSVKALKRYGLVSEDSTSYDYEHELGGL